MRLPLVLVALLTASLAAGCIGAPGKTMTARDGLGDAESAAAEWADGEELRLIGIVAVEPFKRVTDVDETTGETEGEFVTHLDGNPGDGRAPGWAYGFLAGDRCVGVVLAAGLGVLAEGYETCFDLEEIADEAGEDAAAEAEGEMTIGDWSVDSDEAAERLAEHEDWPEVGEDWTFFWALMPGDEEGPGALWLVEGSNQDGLEVEAVVDAETGEVMELEVEQNDWGFFGEVEPSEPGAPGVAGPNGYTTVHEESHPTIVAGSSETISVELEGRGGYLMVHVDVGVAVSAVESCRATLSGPDGDLEGRGFGNGPGGSWDAAWDQLPPGTYTLVLSPGLVGTCVQANMVLDGGWI